MRKVFEIFTDGACQGNPGEASVGFVIFQDGKVIKEFAKTIGTATNNIAEYTALVYALQESLILRADEVTVNTDSELLYNQIKGSYKIKNETLKFLSGFVQHLAQGFKKMDMKLIPREQNKKADQLATEELKKQVKMVAPLFNLGEESPSSEG